MSSLRNELKRPLHLGPPGADCTSLRSSEVPTLPLKQTIAAIVLLLQPAQPSPADPAKRLEELRRRLVESQATLPREWLDEHGWHSGFEMETLVGADALTARRALELMLELQRFLELEFAPESGGFTEKDFALGTLDSKATRLALQTIAQSLLILTTNYLQTATVPPYLSQTILGIIKLATFPSTTPPTLVTQLTQTHLSTTTLCSITLGWTPSHPPQLFAYLRSQLIKLLNDAGPAQAMAILSGATRAIRTSATAGRRFPAYVERTIGMLLSRQLVARGGVRGLLENVFGERTGQEAVAADPAKLEHVASVLSTLPKEITAERYFGVVIPALVNAINPPEDVPPSPSMHVHAASYTVSHLLSGPHADFVVAALQEQLHVPLRPVPPTEGATTSNLPSLISLGGGAESTIATSASTVRRILQTLNGITVNAPPGSKIWQYLISPILPLLFSLSASLALPYKGKGKGKGKIVAIDDEQADWFGMVGGLIEGWGRVSAEEEVEAGLWTVLQSGRGWKVDSLAVEDDNKTFFWDSEDGSPCIVYGEEDQTADISKISLIPEGDDTAAMLSMLPLHPNPSHFADILKAINRRDVAGNVFLKALGEYRIRAEASGGEDLQTILFLQIVLQIVDKLGESVLGRSEQVLAFVENTLAGAAKEATDGMDEVSSGLAGVNLAEAQEEDAEEDSGLGKLGSVPTAISLLLAVLEANEDVTASTHAILHPIEAHLRVLSEDAASSDTKKLARESLLILSARQALSSFAPASSKPTAITTSQETYRKALSLVQDPLLPVRAHGLIMLTDLVLSPTYDRALTPNIMELFMHSVQDSDSYIYLNAVKGLANMVDAMGKEVLVSLVRTWRGLVEKGGRREMGRDEMEKGLRIGEALCLIVQRLGLALSVHADKIIPPMLATFPARHLPTIVRSSALSILAACAEADPQALLPWSQDVVGAVLDLIQIESVSMTRARPVAQITEVKPEDADAPVKKQPVIVDDEPINVNDSSHPVLRRGALVFLGLHIHSLLATERVDAPSMPVVTLDVRPKAMPRSTQVLPDGLLQRARTILGYVKETDVDALVRQQAGEVEAMVRQLRGGWIG